MHNLPPEQDQSQYIDKNSQSNNDTSSEDVGGSDPIHFTQHFPSVENLSGPTQ